jgi:formylglycine-generating enzyme required for sulfatase activity
MKLFVSYARVDQPICRDIVSTLRAHEVWYDERIYGAQKWWDKIQEMIDWSTGFVYLLSPESVESEYCRKELAIALNSGDKHIFPVIVQDHPDKHAKFPEDLRAYQWIDMREWRSHEAVANLLNAIYVAEIGGQRRKTAAPRPVEPPQPIHERPDAASVIEQADRLMDAQQFDPALLLLRSLIEGGAEVPSRIRRILDEMIRECEEKLARQTYERQVLLEYAPLAAAVRGKRTRELGCAAFADFRREFPDYDPDNLAAICAEFANAHPSHLPKRALPPPFEWCHVPAGRVTIEYGEWQGSGYVVARTQTFDVSPFKIAKYPITNAQFQMFADDVGGFANHEWWNFSDAARQWRRENPTPAPPAFPGDDHPRGNLCWYEAMAFCRWLTALDGDLIISLPTEQQWQWAAQGEAGRVYPWGDEFEAARCNTHESGIAQTTPVTACPLGASPFGLFDLAGNVWEWCLTVNNGAAAGEERARVLRGGSWDYDLSFARAAFRGRSFPHRRVVDFGFRICCTS